MNDDELDDLLRTSLAQEARNAQTDRLAFATGAPLAPAPRKSRRSVWVGVAVAAVVAVAGVGLAAVGLNGSDRSTVNSDAPDAPRQVVAPPDDQRTAACGALKFRAAAVTGRAGDQPGVFDDPPGKALQRFLDDPDSFGVAPTSDVFKEPGTIVELTRTESQVDYLYSLVPTAITLSVTSARQLDGTWKVTGFGNCAPQIINSNTWELTGPDDPSSQLLQITYLAAVGNCNGGGPRKDIDAQRIELRETDTTVELTVIMPDPLTYNDPLPQGGGASTVGCLPTALRQATVHLRQPLGTRTVLDGGAIPAAPPGPPVP